MNHAALIADLVLSLHAAFVIFVVAGGLLVARWPKIAVFHLPAVAWGMAVEFFDWPCPLTPLEDHFRQLAGGTRYAQGFLADHLERLLYPGWLTREIQLALGLALLLFNLAVYRSLCKRWRSPTRRP